MLTRSLKVLETVASWLEKLSLGFAILLLLAMFGLMLSSIISRELVHRPIMWTEELLSFSFSYSIFIVVGVAARTNDHIRIGFFLERLVGERKAQRISTTLENVIGLGIAAFLAYTAYRWTAASYVSGQREFTHLVENFYPLWYVKVLPTVGMGCLSFFYLERCVKQLLGFVASRRDAVSGDSGVINDYGEQSGEP